MSRGLLIRELPGSERPRERLMEKGADALRNSELIAIILRTGIKGASAIQVAEQILKQFDSLHK
jgi:DNA repair protein RadC